jgi:hypothetical protein
MILPTPTPEEVREFAAIYEREFGVALDEEQAWEAATRALRLFCLGTYGLDAKPAEPPSNQP